MAFRILPNGIQECDTIEEFRQLRSSRDRSPTQGKRGSAKSDLSESARSFLGALINSSASRNTGQLSEELNMSAKKFPPILRVLAKWCDERKLHLDALMTREPVLVNRRPQTDYQLTAEGRKVFAPLVGAQSMNGKESTVNTS